MTRTTSPILATSWTSPSSVRTSPAARRLPRRPTTSGGTPRARPTANWSSLPGTPARRAARSPSRSSSTNGSYRHPFLIQFLEGQRDFLATGRRARAGGGAERTRRPLQHREHAQGTWRPARRTSGHNAGRPQDRVGARLPRQDRGRPGNEGSDTETFGTVSPTSRRRSSRSRRASTSRTSSFIGEPHTLLAGSHRPIRPWNGAPRIRALRGLPWRTARGDREAPRRSHAAERGRQRAAPATPSRAGPAMASARRPDRAAGLRARRDTGSGGPAPDRADAASETSSSGPR